MTPLAPSQIWLAVAAVTRPFSANNDVYGYAQ